MSAKILCPHGRRLCQQEGGSKASKASEEVIKLQKETTYVSLTDATNSVFTLQDEDGYRGTRMSKFRSGNGIKLLMTLYNRIGQRYSNPD